MWDPKAEKKTGEAAAPAAKTGGLLRKWRAAGKANEAAASAAAAAAAGARAAVPRVRLRQILCLIVVILLFTFGVLGSIILWQTRMWDDYIDYQITIRNDTPSYKKWADSDVTSTIKYHIFNYTNVNEFISGKESKLRVQEVGPYTFREKNQRVNPVFHDNGTVSYNELRSHHFVPEMSNGSMTDNITSIHVLYVSLNYVARRMDLVKQFPVWSFVQVMKPTATVTRTAHEWFWGYNDAVKGFAELREGPIKAGMVESANGTSPDRMTVYTGVSDIHKLGLITHYNGVEKVNFYNTDECNRVDGSDGARFPPDSVRQGATIMVYHREACRRVPIVYEKDVEVWDNIPALRFKAPPNLFDNGEDTPENACFCTADYYEKCYPSGVINTKHCRNGGPFFVSFPHFLHANKWYLENVDGLNPDPEKHSMHIDIHQRVGATVAVKSRFQMNLLMDDFIPDKFLKKTKGMILPWVWTERTMDEWPEELRATFRMLSFVAPAAHVTLLWTCPILAVATGLVLLVCLYVEVAALMRPGPYEQDQQMTRL